MSDAAMSGGTSTSTTNATQGWRGQQAKGLALWASMSHRERWALGLAATTLSLLLLWLLALQPAMRTLRAAPAERARLDEQLQTMQTLAAEARELRALPPLPAGQSGEALRIATEMLGDKARLTLQGERATVVLTGVAPGALRDWLQAARSNARVRPIEATLSYAATAGSPGAGGWSGSVVLALGGGT